MKERIVNNYGTEIKNICRGCAEGVKAKCNQTQKDHLQCALQKSELEEFEVEKYPTSWEELKELCEQSVATIDIGKCKPEGKEEFEYIDIGLFLLGSNKKIYLEDLRKGVIVVAQDITPPQMWERIKGWIGEE